MNVMKKQIQEVKIITGIISLVYFSAGFTYIILSYMPRSALALFFKASLMPLLISIFLVQVAGKRHSGSWLMVLALFFSWTGDILLQFSSRHEFLFLMGLLSFMMTHILYVILFISTPSKTLWNITFGYYAIPLAAYGFLLLWYLYPHLENMKIPVTVYAAVILTMLFSTLIRKGKTDHLGYFLVIAGALLFVLSDSTIAVNNFAHPFPFSRMVIMLTYITGQFLLVMGFVRQWRRNIPEPATTQRNSDWK
jgi:uncharacterized membrane protein YhhN